MNGAPSRTGRPPKRATDGGREVLFEETLSVEDEAGAGRLVGVTRVVVPLVVVVTLAGVGIVAGRFVSAIGGLDVALAIVGGIRSENPLVFVGGLLVGLVLVGYSAFLLVGFARQPRRAFEGRVHVRVTDAGVTVERDGSRLGQSSRVEVPFDAISAVEYLDPDESSTRVDVRELRAPKFLAGRSRDWVRLDRSGDPAVYVGSDRPIELAETIVRRVPDVETAEPF